MQKLFCTLGLHVQLTRTLCRVWEAGLGSSDRGHRCVLHDSLAVSPSDKRSIAAAPRQPLVSLIQTVAAPHFQLESLGVWPGLWWKWMGSSSCLLRAQSDAADRQRLAGGERRLELSCWMQPLGTSILLDRGLGSRCAKSKAELKTESDLLSKLQFLLSERCWWRGMTAVNKAALCSTLN